MASDQHAKLLKPSPDVSAETDLSAILGVLSLPHVAGAGIPPHKKTLQTLHTLSGSADALRYDEG